MATTGTTAGNEASASASADASVTRIDDGALARAEPSPRMEFIPSMKETPGPEATSSTVEVMEALRRARQTAQKDYARIAREKLREDRRERSRGPTLQPLRSPLAKDSS
jgi:hypothetical protein